MSWVHKYVGIPFKSLGRTVDGCDCWGLVRLIYQRELRIALPEYGEISATDLKEVSKHITENNDHEPWKVFVEPKEFDVVVMKFYGSKRVGHVGVIVNPNTRQLIHTERGFDAALVGCDHMTIRNRVVGFRRHRELL